MTLRDFYASYEGTGAGPRHASDGELAFDRQASLLEIVWRRRSIVLATLLLFILGGAIYLLIAPSRYLASTSMLIDPRLGKTVGNDPLQPGYIPDTGAMDSQIKLFTSQTVLSRVAEITHLENVPEFNGSQRSLLQRLLHPNPELTGKVDLRALEDAITIKRPERTYVISIEVLAQSADLAAEISNAIPKAYFEDQISSRVEAARDDSSFVKDKLTSLSVQIKEAEDKIETYKIAHDIIDANGLRSNQQEVADLTKSLGDARAKESDAKAALAEIDQMARNGHLDATSEALHSETIERLRQTQAETDQTVAKIAETLGPNHPELKEAKARANEVKSLIRAELTRLKMSAQQDYQVARQHEQQIAGGVERLKAQSTGLNRDLVPLEAMERNVRVLRASFDRFAQVGDSLSQQEADSPPGRVISIARPPVSPARPRKTLTALISTAGGLFFGLAAALFAESVSAAPEPATAPTPRPRPSREREPKPAARRQSRRYWDDEDT